MSESEVHLGSMGHANGVSDMLSNDAADSLPVLDKLKALSNEAYQEMLSSHQRRVRKFGTADYPADVEEEMERSLKQKKKRLLNGDPVECGVADESVLALLAKVRGSRPPKSRQFGKLPRLGLKKRMEFEHVAGPPEFSGLFVNYRRKFVNDESRFNFYSGAKTKFSWGNSWRDATIPPEYSVLRKRLRNGGRERPAEGNGDTHGDAEPEIRAEKPQRRQRYVKPPPDAVPGWKKLAERNSGDQFPKKIWSDICRRDVPKAAKNMAATRQNNLILFKRRARACAKEVRSKVMRVLHKKEKDMATKTKKLVREMLQYWRFHEKDERELLKKAIKAEQDAKKAEEEAREAKRQQRKLNFLLTQSEIYMHFIASKMATGPGAATTTAPGTPTATTTAAPAPSGPLFSTAMTTPAPTIIGGKAVDTVTVTAEDLQAAASGDKAAVSIDNDDLDDEEALQQKAKVSALRVLKQLEDKTKAFDMESQRLREGTASGAATTTAPTPMQTTTTGAPSSEVSFGDSLSKVDLLDPSTMGAAVSQPHMIKGDLKEYQLKGLSWLANLYEQGINGILADEMGLGKTVQSISLIAHLAERRNIWGPFLIIAPKITLHNWQQEVMKFAPDFKVLPYWGNLRDRKVLRKYWKSKLLYTRTAAFHVLITSYEMVVRDAQYFSRIKWQYMILDEAQAIKSARSNRWGVLLNFNCRNRLLLTGTPIQNSMAELWALLHFIMPTLFDSHDEFNKWFSKDIENHAEHQSGLNEHQLTRLRLILKPFMLRRVKVDVENELPKKTEVETACPFTRRQTELYQGIKAQLSLADLLANSNSTEHLMNLVMQFRKVCNHPELFARRDTKSPFQFQVLDLDMQPPSKHVEILNVVTVNHNPISFRLPRMLYRHGMPNLPPRETATPNGFRGKWLYNMLSVFAPENVHRSLFPRGNEKGSSCFAFTRLTGMSPGELFWLALADPLEAWLAGTPWRRRLAALRYFADTARSCSRADVDTMVDPESAGEITRLRLPGEVPARGRLLIREIYSPLQVATETGTSRLASLIVSDPADRLLDAAGLVRSVYTYAPTVLAPPVEYQCSDRRFNVQQRTMMHHGRTKSLLLGLEASRWCPDEPTDPAIPGDLDRRRPLSLQPDVEWSAKRQPLLGPLRKVFGDTYVVVPDFARLLADSGKLQKLDDRLKTLFAEGHRVLIYSQMTKMLDILEDFMHFRKYTHLRIDGSSSLDDRRDMVKDWQTNPEIFVFLLSTRAGGLGINLTAADTVIFYDSDWNPTIDEQAMDRAHRLGQTKPVTVYRLITRNSVEERILNRARQKQAIQRIVIAGGAFSKDANAFQPQEALSLLLDEGSLQDQAKDKKASGEVAPEAAGGTVGFGGLGGPSRKRKFTGPQGGPPTKASKRGANSTPSQAQSLDEIMWELFPDSVVPETKAVAASTGTGRPRGRPPGSGRGRRGRRRKEELQLEVEEEEDEEEEEEKVVPPLVVEKRPRGRPRKSATPVTPGGTNSSVPPALSKARAQLDELNSLQRAKEDEIRTTEDAMAQLRAHGAEEAALAEWQTQWTQLSQDLQQLQQGVANAESQIARLESGN